MTDQEYTDLGKLIVSKIVADLTDRRGLRQEWESIDKNTRDSIIQEWVEITVKELKTVG